MIKSNLSVAIGILLMLSTASNAYASDAPETGAGRGAAMGIYSVLLSIGAIAGLLIAAALGNRFAVDGLIYGTLAMSVIAMALPGRLQAVGVVDARA